jgi:uncharacterized protein YkwD
LTPVPPDVRRAAAGIQERMRTAPSFAAALLLVFASCGGGDGGGTGNAGPPGPDPAPPPGSLAALREHTLARLNEYRASVNSAPLVLDDRLNDFAQEGSEQLARDHVPHMHFNEAVLAGTLFTSDGFEDTAGENQGDPFGWPPAASVEEQIDEILEAMFEEGPGIGPLHGHYRNMVNPEFRRVGVGLHLDDAGRLYFTNDFSG